MLAQLAFTALALASTAQAGLSIIYPSSQTIWYRNDTVHMNWTRTEPTTDTYFFRAYLTNDDQSLFSGSRSIADSTNATAEYVRVLLPQAPAGKGYKVNFVNTTNEEQVFATSEPFEIADGEVKTSSTSSGSSTSSTRTGDIPNAQTQATTSNPFPTSASTPSESPSGSSSGAGASMRLDGLPILFVQMGVTTLLFAMGVGTAF